MKISFNAGDDPVPINSNLGQVFIGVLASLHELPKPLRGIIVEQSIEDVSEEKNLSVSSEIFFLEITCAIRIPGMSVGEDEELLQFFFEIYEIDTAEKPELATWAKQQFTDLVHESIKSAIQQLKDSTSTLESLLPGTH